MATGFCFQKYAFVAKSVCFANHLFLSGDATYPFNLYFSLITFFFFPSSDSIEILSSKFYLILRGFITFSWLLSFKSDCFFKDFFFNFSYKISSSSFFLIY